VAYVPRQARLERETVLVSSGGDGIFPPGVPTVKVVRIRETSEPFLEIGAVPTADLQSVRVVLLLPEWSRQGG
jgi:cell shape-determining protein MreC